MQEALIAAGVDVAGGADGVYGNDTMVAVAEYQRSDDDLQETGAVDVATARALGVYQDSTGQAPTTTAPATIMPKPSQVPVISASTDQTDNASGDGRTRWLLLPAAAVVAFAATVAGRRRYVVAQRAARRRARIHPATSPGRSIAELRRAGQLEGAQLPVDHSEDGQLGEPTAIEPAATAP